jgi:osmoprotectant transport system permease protein
VTALWQWLTDPAHWSGPNGLVQRLAEHVGYATAATVFAAVLVVPVALWIGHTGRGRLLAVQIGNLGRAIPTFGLILAAFTLFGYGLTPVYIALVALAVPPILVNTVAGIRQVDPEIVEAARGMGMTGAQVLWRVELPIALPVLMAGIRTSAVQVVATATLAAVIGLGGLGRPIIDGLAQGVTYNPDARAMVIAGALGVALLSVLTEWGLSAVERRLAATRGRTPNWNITD